VTGSERGRVLIVEDGQIQDPPFLNLYFQATSPQLYGIAFHPGYPNPGYLFVHWADDDGASVISRFTVSADPDRLDPGSAVELLRIPKEFGLHYGGQLAFGPDGYFYVSTGDGTGQGGAEFVDPHCAAQSSASLEGKILRLDVDVDTPPYYAIPPDNPFAGSPSARPEIWDLGLRNPWRMAFDRVTGDLWLTDVGHDRREEVDFEPAGDPGGHNYGWKVIEGTLCFGNQNGCDASVPSCDSAALTGPVLEYSHGSGRCSIIGGFVYRGGRIQALEGRYLYGDYCSGEIWAATRQGSGWTSEVLPVTTHHLTSFAEDADGELLVMDGNALYRLVDRSLPAPCAPDATHLCLNDDRFEVSVHWRTAQGNSGFGHAEKLNQDSGFFWFFSPNNPEVFVKVLDACAIQDFEDYWVFAAGLTDVETHLEVVDTRTGERRTYDRDLGKDYQPVRDTAAFATCP